MNVRVGTFLAAVVFVCSASPTFAQGGISGGVKGGFTFADVALSSDLEGDEVDDFIDRQEEAIKRDVGFAFGGFVDVPFTERVSFQPEFLYVRKGTKAEEDFEEDFDEAGVLAGRFEQSSKVDQIQVPLLAKVTFAGTAVRPFIVAGPALGFIVRAREKQEVVDLELDGDPFTPNAEEQEFLEDIGFIYDDDIKDDIKSFELSLIVGGGVRFGSGSVEARYDHGLTDLNDEEDEGIEVRTRTFSILFGWSWP